MNKAKTIEDLRKEFDSTHSNEAMPIREWLSKYSEWLEQKLISEPQKGVSARDFYNKRISEDSTIGSIQLMEEYAKHSLPIVPEPQRGVLEARII